MQNKMVIFGSVFFVLITGIQTEIQGKITKGFIKNNRAMSSSESTLSSPVTDDGNKMDNTQIITQAIQNMTESYNVANTSLTNGSVSYNATNNEEYHIFMNDSNVKSTKSRDVNMTMFNTADSNLTEANMTRANATENQTYKNQTAREVSNIVSNIGDESRSGEEEQVDKDEDEDEDEEEEEEEQQEDERREEGTDDYRVERDYDDAGFSDNYNYNYMQQRGEMEMEHLNHQAKLFNELGLRQSFEDWSISLDERMEDMVRVLGEDENLPYKELKIPHSAYKSSDNKSEPKLGTGYNDFSFIDNFSEDYNEYQYHHKDF